MRRHLTFACGATDRVAAIVDGRVGVDGISLNTMVLPVEEIFFRAVRYREFDFAELSLSSYAMSLDHGAPYVAIPAFPSRAFRHSGIWINTSSGITRPSDLIGRVVGVPEYQMTAAVWIRGTLQEHYGVPVDSVRYVTGGLFSPGREEKIPVSPPGISLTRLDDASLSTALAQGRIDALYSPYPPTGALDGTAPVARLWPEFRAEETRYFRETKIFPIMHVVAVRRDIYDSDPWVARALFVALEKAKNLAIASLGEGGSLAVALPFAFDEARATRELFGADYWPYGLEPNRKTIDTLMDYAFNQGLTKVRRTPDELFAVETHSSFSI